jgi:hypothetical protein
MAVIRKVQAIMPADGWRALYKPVDDDGSWFYRPLVCFGAIDESHGPGGGEGEAVFVVGFDASGKIIRVCDRNNNFMGYVPPGEDLPSDMSPEDVPDDLLEE